MPPIWMIIALACTFVWLFPPIRQYRTQYFFYFLILGITDVISAILVLAFRISPLFIYPIESLLLIILLTKNKTSRIALAITIIVYLIFHKLASIPTIVLYIINDFLMFIITLFVIREFYLKIIVNKVLNWFLIVLVVYFISNCLKILSYIINPAPGIIQFHITSFLQIAFGIFFCFVNVENSNWKLEGKLFKSDINNGTGI